MTLNSIVAQNADDIRKKRNAHTKREYQSQDSSLFFHSLLLSQKTNPNAKNKTHREEICNYILTYHIHN